MQSVHQKLLLDFTLAAALWLLSLVTLILIQPALFELLSLFILGVVSAMIIAPLIFRRTKTVAAAIAMVVIFLLQVIFGFPLLPANISIIVIVHALANYAPRRASLVGLLTAYAGVVIGFFAYDSLLFVQEVSPLMRVMLWLLTLALITSAWLLGNVQRSRRALVADLTEHAKRLEKEQQQELALAAAEERARIAREMHDIVAHSLTVIVTQADGASYAAKNNPRVATETLQTIASISRDALQEMRRLLGVLRQDELVALGPAPNLDSLTSLLDEIRAAGITVKFSAPDLSSAKQKLPKGAELAAYRAVQEALTNVIKHAGPNVTVTVTISSEVNGLLLEIIDDGRGAAATPATSGSGQGIKGMRERIALYGGTVVAQPKLGGGFAVHAWIPYQSGERTT